MGLEEELGAAADAAAAFTDQGEALTAVLPAEPAPGLRIYLCAYGRDGDAPLAWLALDASGEPIGDRVLVRDAVSIVGLCELAEESAAGGDVAELRTQLAELREREQPDGIEEAEEAAAALAEVLAAPPRVATLAYLDAIGTAVSVLERALGEAGASPFALAMKSGTVAVDELSRDVERGYKRPLS